MTVLVSPHNDDAALFASWTVLRECPLVVVVFDGYVQGKRGLHVTAEERRAEDEAALFILNCSRVCFFGFRDDDPTVTESAIRRKIDALGPTEVYAPAIEENGHAQHNLIARACNGLPGKRYLTYTAAGKSRSGLEVPILEASWIAKKLRALACYESQHSLDHRMGCWPHFVNDLREYYSA